MVEMAIAGAGENIILQDLVVKHAKVKWPDDEETGYIESMAR